MITNTRWGSYEVIAEGPKYKVKILTFNPGCGISFQKHFKRSENWQVVEGEVKLAIQREYNSKPIIYRLDEEFSTVFINVEEWHQVWNFSDKPAKIVEIQYGECEEEDIERIQHEWIGDK